MLPVGTEHMIGYVHTKNTIPAFDYLMVTFGNFMQEKDFDSLLNNIFIW